MHIMTEHQAVRRYLRVQRVLRVTRIGLCCWAVLCQVTAVALLVSIAAPIPQLWRSDALWVLIIGSVWLGSGLVALQAYNNRCYRRAVALLRVAEHRAFDRLIALLEPWGGNDVFDTDDTAS